MEIAIAFWFRLALTLTPSTKKWTADGRHRAYLRVVEIHDVLRRMHDYFHDLYN